MYWTEEFNYKKVNFKRLDTIIISISKDEISFIWQSNFEEEIFKHPISGLKYEVHPYIVFKNSKYDRIDNAGYKESKVAKT